MRRLLPALAILCLAPWSVLAAEPKSAPIRLAVDLSNAPQRIYHARLEIPVQAGPLTLYYPKWIPGNHGPSGPISDLAGLKLQGGGKVVRWQRDDIDMYAFHCTVPEGVSTLDVALDLLAAGRGGFGDATQNIAVLRWNQIVLYPKGKPIDSIDFQASVKVPAGWKLRTALPIVSQTGDVTQFGVVDLDTLVDSPVLTGRYFREVQLGTGDPAHYLDLAADSAAALEITPKQKAAYEKLVAEAGALFGVRHYKFYRFLVTLSDKMPHHGLEHHQSSDDGMGEHDMSDDESGRGIATLLPHEYVHSWNGKFRRPAGLVTPTYQEDNNTRLLWVYEGLTDYLGMVLAARSGLYTPEQARDYLALTAQHLQNTKGRNWRPLEDTTLIAPMRGYEASSGWTSWRRSVDYYDEGILIWLEIDTKIRELTDGKKSIDDFCKLFHGGPGGKAEVKPYEFDDVIAGLNAVAPYDWKTLINERLTQTVDNAPLAGIVQGGWRLVLTEKPSAFEKATQGGRRRGIDLSTSLGLVLGQEGNIMDVVLGTPAYKGGIGPGMKVVAINGRKFSPKVLDEALVATKKPNNPVEVLVEDGDFYRTYKLDYQGGPRHPHLERIKGQPDYLDQIFTPVTGPAEKHNDKKPAHQTAGK
jgi:predicted metalloprotease with PDZ domain